MLTMTAVFLSLFLSLPMNVRATLGLRHEPGVETRLPLTLAGELTPAPRTRLAAGIAADLLRPGLPDRFAFEAGREIGGRAEVAVGVKVRHWPDWRVGENLAFAVARLEPRPGLEFEAGIARRVPVLDTHRWRSPLVWTGPLAEWNVVYGVGWRFLDHPRLGLAVRTGNRGMMDLRTPGLIGIRFDAASRLGPGLTAIASLAGEIKGLSAALAELGAVGVELGVRRGF